MERIRKLPKKLVESIARLCEIEELPSVEEGVVSLQHSIDCHDSSRLMIQSFEESLPGGSWVPSVTFNRTLLVCSGCDAKVQVRKNDD